MFLGAFLFGFLRALAPVGPAARFVSVCGDDRGVDKIPNRD